MNINSHDGGSDGSGSDSNSSYNIHAKPFIGVEDDESNVLNTIQNDQDLGQKLMDFKKLTRVILQKDKKEKDQGLTSKAAQA